VGQLMEVGIQELVFLVGIAMLAGGVAAVLTLRLSRWIAVRMESVPYRKLCSAVLLLVTGLVFFYSGLVGLLVFATATAIGMLPGFVHVKRTHCMGVIMVPCILYFAGAKGAVLGWMGL